MSLLLMLLLPSCGGGAREVGAPSVTSNGSAKTLHITALGDSVPAGTACGCSPYPELSAADISAATNRTYQARNDAVAGFTTTDVIDQLTHDPHVIDDVRNAAGVTVEVGANDVAHSSQCANNADCYLVELPHLRAHLEAILRRIRQLTAGRTIPVVLLGYWSVWLGGKYAQEQGTAYVEAADAVTTGVNDTVLTVAHATGSTYVDLRKAFRGPDESWDETHLLAPDGEHPNAEGHLRIAQAIAAATHL